LGPVLLALLAALLDLYREEYGSDAVIGRKLWSAGGLRSRQITHSKLETCPEQCRTVRNSKQLEWSKSQKFSKQGRFGFRNWSLRLEFVSDSSFGIWIFETLLKWSWWTLKNHRT
jgi:hypothetical protein